MYSSQLLLPSGVGDCSKGNGSRWNIHHTSIVGFLFFFLVLLSMSSHALAKPTPNVSITPANNISTFLGEPFSFSLTFDNTNATGSEEIGYNPLIELILPPEVTFAQSTSAVFGSLNPVSESTIDADGEVTNPVTGETLTGLPVNATYLVFELPVGSFTPDQTPLVLNIDVELASDVAPGVPLGTNATAIGVYALGEDALNNPGSDPVIRGEVGGVTVDPDPSYVGEGSQASITPVLFIPDKTVQTIDGEDETATGPNFPVTYTLSTDVANTATLNDLSMQEALPDNLHFTGITDIEVNTSSGDPNVQILFTSENGTASLLYNSTVSGASFPIDGPIPTPPGGNSGGHLEVTFSSITGEEIAQDVSITYESYVPEFDTQNSTIIDPASGADVEVLNEANATALAASGDFGEILDLNATIATGNATIWARNMATQKSVSIIEDNNVSGLSPGDRVRFTIKGQVSDYFSQNSTAIQDILGDGYDYSGNATLTFATENGSSFGTPFFFEEETADPAPDITQDGDEYPFPSTGTLLITQNATAGDDSGGSPGFTSLVFDISAYLGELDGGALDGSDADGYKSGITDDTRFTLSFEAVIQENYENNASYNVDPSIDAFDTLNNYATISGLITSVDGGQFDTESTGSSQSIAPPELQKSIAAINGDSDLPDPLEIRPGDEITFSLQITIPTGALEQLKLDDYLPLPILDVDRPDGENTGTWTFNNTILTSGSYPSPGWAAFGPNTTLSASYTPTDFPPTLNATSSENRLEFLFGNATTFEPSPPQEITVQLLFTIAVNTDPFADNLFITNFVTKTSQNSVSDTKDETKVIGFTLREPELRITKGVQSTDGEGQVEPSPGLPVDSDLEDADAGDTVSYVITVENTGGSEAYNATITDPQVPGLTDCTLVSVTNGIGTYLVYTGDLNNGIELTDPLAENDGSTGPPYGADTALLTINCTLADSVIPRQVIENKASITFFTNVSGGENFAQDEGLYQDEATVTIAAPNVDKKLIAVDPGGAQPNGVTTGDILTYELTVTLPEGTTPGLTLEDQLPAGFAYNNTVSVDTSGFNGTLETSSPDITISSQNIAFNFGNTTVQADQDPTNNSFSLTFEALVEDDAANDGISGAQGKENEVELDYTGRTGEEITATQLTEFREPDLKITKNMAPSTVDGGDTVTVTLQVTNEGTSPAYDILVEDTLDSTVFDLNSVTQGTTPGGFTWSYDSSTGKVTYTSDNGFSLAAGDSLDFDFEVTVNSDVTTGSEFENTASVQGDSQDGDPPSGIDRGTNDNQQETLSIQSVSVDKDLIATSETWTDGNTAAVGEILTYELAVTIPEGTTNASSATPIIQDQLPSGFAYVNDTAEIWADYNSTAGMTADNYDSGSLLPLSATPIVPGVENEPATGQLLSFDLGTIVNNDHDENNEKLFITFRVLVQNTADVNRGDTKTNTLTFTYLNNDGNEQSATDTHQSTIGEPDLLLEKTVSPQSVQGNEQVTFKAVLTNQDGTNVVRAWDPEIIDSLPSEYTDPYQVVNATLSRGDQDVTPIPGFTNNTLSADLSALDDHERYLAPGESLTVFYTAYVSEGVPFAQIITNTAEGQGTSLPGLKGSDSNANDILDNPGHENGERTGSGTPATNDLDSTDDAQTRLGVPEFSKQGDAELQIGGNSTMTVSISVPVGTTPDLNMTDTLPQGLVFTGEGDITIPTDVDVDTTPSDPDTNSTEHVFAFGQVENSAQTAQPIEITYGVRVENDIGNQRNTRLANNATLRFIDAQGDTRQESKTATVSVIEPNLELDKLITDGSTNSTAGDPISYELVLENVDSKGTAYNVDFKDILPPALLGGPDGNGADPHFCNATLDNFENKVLVSATQEPLNSTQASITGNNNSTLTWPFFDMPPGSKLTVTYKARLVNDLGSNATLTNNATATYFSQPGDKGRDGTPGSDDDDNSDLNNYREFDDASVTPGADISIEKSLSSGQADDKFTIGEQVEYDLKVGLIEGTSDRVTVTENHPESLRFEEMVTTEAGNANLSFNGTSVPSEENSTLIFDLGTIKNPADDSTQNDYLTLRLRFTVTNSTANQNGVLLANNATVNATVNTQQVQAGPEVQEIQVTEPDLEVVKTALDPNPTLGDEVTFEITVQHTQNSTSDAFNVVLTDALPVHLSYVPGSTTGPVQVVDTNSSMPSFSMETITLAESSKSFQFRAEVSPEAVVDQTVYNQIVGVYSSRPDNDPDERDYMFEGQTPVTPSITSLLDAQKTVQLFDDRDGNGVLTPGDILKYWVKIDNQGADAVQNMVFSDTIPQETEYVNGTLQVSAQSGTSNVVPDDSQPPDLELTADSMESGGFVEVEFQVQLKEGNPPGTNVSNFGVVDSDQTVPEPTDEDGIDANGDQTTDILVGGMDEPALYAQKIVALTDDQVDPEGVINVGDVLTYTIILSNVGNGTLENVEFTDTFPDKVQILGVTNAQWDGSSREVNAPFASIPEGEQEVITVTAEVLESGVIENQGSAVTDQTDEQQTDSNGTPLDGEQPTLVEAAPAGGEGAPGSPNLSMSKEDCFCKDVDGDGQVSPGDILRYLITIQNTGSAPATNVSFTDSIPDQVTFIPGSLNFSQGADLGSTSEQVRINLGTIGPGGVATVQFRVQLDAVLPTGTRVSNTGVLTAAGDISLEDTVTTDVESNPNLFDPPNVTKTVDGSGFPVLTYEAVLINSGNAPAEDVIFRDPIPENTTFEEGSIVLNGSSVPDDEGFTGNAVRVNIPEIDAKGGRATIRFSVRVNSGFYGTISNQGMVSIPGTSFPDEPTDDPNTDPDNDPTEYKIAPPAPVPSLGTWAKILLVASFLGLGLWTLGRNREDHVG